MEKMDHLLELANTPGATIPGLDYEDFVMGLFAPHDDPAARFSHAAMGIVTELNEIRNSTSDTNLLEEFGDLFFFDTALIVVLREATPIVDRATAILRLSVWDAQTELEQATDRTKAKEVLEGLTVKLLNTAKRWLAYREVPNLFEVLTLMTKVQGIVHSLHASNLDVDVMYSEAVKANVRKLWVRYQGKYTTEKALNRDLQAESDALKG